MLNRLWKLWIAAQEMAIQTDELFFHIGDTFSPYSEVSLKSLQAAEGQILENEIAVNPFYCWNSIFSPMLDTQLGEYDELTLMISDMILHYIAEADAFSGMSKEEFYTSFIVRDMECGIYGCRDKFALFSNNEKRKIADRLLCLYRTNQPLFCLTEAISVLFPGAGVHLGENRQLFVFMNQSKDQVKQHKLDVVFHLFLNLDFRPQVYWEKIPGIIGMEETMGIEEFVIG